MVYGKIVSRFKGYWSVWLAMQYVLALLTLVLLNYWLLFFIHLKLELLTQIADSDD